MLVCVTLVDALTNFVRSFKELFTAEEVPLGEIVMQPFTRKQAEEAVSVLEYVWKPIHEMLEYILKEADNEVLTQQILHNIQDLVNMAGTVSLGSGLQSIIFTLCSWEFPENLKELENAYKYIYICNLILNIAQSNNRVLDKKSWVFILSYLQQVTERIYGPDEMKKVQLSSIEQKVAENCAKYLQGGKHSKMVKGEEASNAMLIPFPSKEDSSEQEAKSEQKEASVEKKRSSNLVSADANINFYMINAMLAKQKNTELSDSSDIVYKQSKDDAFQEEIDLIKNSLESLFVFTSLFDVLCALL